MKVVRLTKAGRRWRPEMSSQPRIGTSWTLSMQSLAQRSSGMLLPSSHSSSPSRMALPQQPWPAGQSLASSQAVPLPVHLPAIWQVAVQGLSGAPLTASPRSHCSEGGSVIPSPQRHVGSVERAVVAGITEAVAVAVRLARVRDAGTVVEPVEDAVVVGVGQEADGLDGLAVEPRAAHRIGAVEVEVDRPDRGRAEALRVAQEIARGVVCRQRARRRSPEDEGGRIEEVEG